MKKRVVIGGCRDYENYEVFCKYVDIYLSRIGKENKIVIVSGHCSGVDVMAERYAKENGYAVEIYPADWKKYGRAAGPKRNKLMVETADYVIAFWDGRSRGTKSLIDYAVKLKKPMRVVDIGLSCKDSLGIKPQIP